MKRVLKRLIPTSVNVAIRRSRAKTYWASKTQPAANSEKIIAVAKDSIQSSTPKVLEFGANGGGNLIAFLEAYPHARVVGVDVNSVVERPSAKWDNYTGITGDERRLLNFSNKEFDLAFTVSVLDHIPSRKVVVEVLSSLCRISRRIILLEPFLCGQEGDVSNQLRHLVDPRLKDDGSKFANFCFFWNYDVMLNDLEVRWDKVECPLHSKSLGPYYWLYQIDPN